MKARVQENRAKVVEAEAEVPLAMAEAFREGNLGIMDYYNMRNVRPTPRCAPSPARVPRSRRIPRIPPAATGAEAGRGLITSWTGLKSSGCWWWCWARWAGAQPGRRRHPPGRPASPRRGGTPPAPGGCRRDGRRRDGCRCARRGPGAGAPACPAGRRVEAGPRVPRPRACPSPNWAGPSMSCSAWTTRRMRGWPVDGPPRPKPGVPRPRVRRRRPVGETPAAGPAAPRAVPSAVPSAVPEAAALLPAGSEGEPGGEGPLVAALGAGAGREEPEQGLHRPPASAAGGAAAWGLSSLARAVAWSVILGPPRAYQPWRPVGWRRGV